MRKGNAFVDTVNQIVTYGVEQGILHLYTGDESFTGNRITLKGKAVVNFGSCSYLGLEFDPRLKRAAQEAIECYGTQFSESRAYVSLTLYRELEELLEKIFEAYPVITPTTTLGHIAAIPVLVGDEDAVITDQQVHNSVQTAVNLLKPRGIHVEILRHSRLDLLEERITDLQAKHAKVWYMADGIYSMFGDECPVREVYRLLEKYSALHFYVDDAHGMGIRGRYGRGSVLDGRELHARMVMATSLNKSFASGGGLLLFPRRDWAQKVRCCGGPMITSGPMQPGSLGAAVAAAKIHLSDEIYTLQGELQDRIRYATMLLKKHRLPVVSKAGAAVFFVGVGLPKLGYRLVEKMLKAGYYVNLGIFPAVPMKQTGVRFTITRLHSFAQIEGMIRELSKGFREVLAEEHYSLEDIYKAFKMKSPGEVKVQENVNTLLHQSFSLKMEHYGRIDEVSKRDWDALFSGKGSFDWNGLYALEQCFRNNSKPEDCWKFDYLVIRDNSGRIVLATFLTTTVWKEDMLSAAEVSLPAEKKRKNDPYYLTSRVVSTGSLLTEGEHIYINKASPLWKDALKMLVEKMSSLQEQYKADSVVLRDFREPDKELDEFFTDIGFFRVSMPETNVVNGLDWEGAEGFYRQLSKRSRQHFREDVRKYRDKFEVSVNRKPVCDEEADTWYRLYLNVKNHSLELNTFPLPRKVFSVLPQAPGWEVLRLKLKTGAPKEPLVCMVLCYRSGDAYTPIIIGMDYTYNKQYKIYRQALYQLVLRAAQLGKKRIYLGFSASIEKKKVGAKQYATYGYMQTNDTYSMQVLAGANIASGTAGTKENLAP
jgi:7-keto-8-aminopelargonate synthetase-like enzyme